MASDNLLSRISIDPNTAVFSEIGDNKAIQKQVRSEAVFHGLAREGRQCYRKRRRLFQKSSSALRRQQKLRRALGHAEADPD